MGTKPVDIAALLAHVANAQGAPPPALLAMVAALVKGPTTRPAEALESLFARKAQDFLALRERLALAIGDDECRRLRREAAAAIETGRFAEADKALALAELHLLDGSTDLTALAEARRLWAGETRADRAATSFLRTAPEAYVEAAQRYGEASALVGLADLPRSRALALAQIAVQARKTEDLGGREGLDASMAGCRRLLDGLDSLVEPVAFAAGQAALADALDQLSGITGEAGPRAEALEACRAGLDDLRRNEAPDLWRRLQARLGVVALALGAAQDDEALLEEAVAALASALSAWDRDRDAPGWLDREHDIARARALLGGKRSDLALLERAFNSFNRVATAIDRAREPLRWAGLQDDMGNVLVAMGERYSEPVVLEEAVAAFGLALEERKREAAPLLWATSSANQALATMELARRQRDAGVAQRALAQIVAAVEAMRGAGYAANAAKLEKKLVEAGAMAEKLRKR
jgi:tetratricopeptide (TPR) repeat protein